MAQIKQKAEKKKRPRTCVGCGEESPKKALLRVVRTPEGEVEYDPTGKANGRGAYVCADPECLKQAKKKNALSRALKTAVPDKLYEALALLIAEKTDGQTGTD
ncbi:YlxR family protein [Synergistaceae bacterium OttesenSCG-928-D05]|nr:YlxR family protein [Synergistaceae bacterium OttesenSCG-928-D05]